LFQQSAAFQRELATLQRGFNCTQPTDHGVKSELGDDELDEMKKNI